MNGILDLVKNSLDGDALDGLSRQLGQNPEITSKAIDSALPMIVGALAKNSVRDGGAGVARAVETRHDGSILDNLSGFLGKPDTRDGDGILRHVLGERRAAAELAVQSASGIDSRQASSLLATLAPIVMGAVGRQRQTQQLDAGGLAGMLAGESEQIEKKSPGFMGALGGLLDADGDGDTDLGDLLKHGKSGLGRLFR